MLRLGLTYASDDPAFGDIAAKASRAIDPSAGKTQKDKQHRAALRKSIQREMRAAGPELYPHALFLPDKTWPELDGPRYAVGVRSGALNILAEKLTRGIAYIYDTTYIADTHRFLVQHLHRPIGEIHAMLNRHGVHVDQGPGISARWAVMKDDPETRVHYYSILGRWQVYVFAVPKNLEERVIAEREAQLRALELHSAHGGEP